MSRKKQYYSVPNRLLGQKVNVIITSLLVRMYYQCNCVATHPAGLSCKYITIAEHLPSLHQIVLKGMNAQYLEERARRNRGTCVGGCPGDHKAKPLSRTGL